MYKLAIFKDLQGFWKTRLLISLSNDGEHSSHTFLENKHFYYYFLIMSYIFQWHSKS